LSYPAFGGVASSVSWGAITGKPTFAEVATSGSYDSLSDLPSLFNGTYAALSGKPTLGSAASTESSTYALSSTYVYQSQIGTVASTEASTWARAVSTYVFQAQLGTAASTAASTYALVSSYVYQAQLGTAASTAASTYVQASALGTAASTASSSYTFAATTGTPTAATFLRGDRTWAAPSGGSDPWTYVRMTSDRWVSSSGQVSVTGFAFAPSASTRYEIEAQIMCRTSSATCGPRPGIVWPTNLICGTVSIWMASAANAQVLGTGDFTSSNVVSLNTGLPNATGWWPGQMIGQITTSASTAGNFQVMLRSEINATSVGMRTDSFIKYRTVP
jgi:hypothetical protein